MNTQQNKQEGERYFAPTLEEGGRKEMFRIRNTKRNVIIKFKRKGGLSVVKPTAVANYWFDT